MLLSTTAVIEGRPVMEYLGVVTGETIIGANFVKDFFASIRDIVGGRSGSYEKVLREAKDTAMREMEERAAMTMPKPEATYRASTRASSPAPNCRR